MAPHIKHKFVSAYQELCMKLHRLFLAKKPGHTPSVRCKQILLFKKNQPWLETLVNPPELALQILGSQDCQIPYPKQTPHTSWNSAVVIYWDIVKFLTGDNYQISWFEMLLNFLIWDVIKFLDLRCMEINKQINNCWCLFSSVSCLLLILICFNGQYRRL